MLRDEIQEMVERISWFSPVDYEILEFFEDHDIVASPKVIAANIGYDRQYVSKRCRILVDREIFLQPSDGLYELSDVGRDFLYGKVDPQIIEDAAEE